MVHGEWQFDGEAALIKNKYLPDNYPLKSMIATWKGSTYELLVSDCVYGEKQYNFWMEREKTI